MYGIWIEELDANWTDDCFCQGDFYGTLLHWMDTSFRKFVKNGFLVIGALDTGMLAIDLMIIWEKSMKGSLRETKWNWCFFKEKRNDRFKYMKHITDVKLQ
jgi:hypothetical protein